MTNMNQEIAQDAAEDYSDDPELNKFFVSGWLFFCDGTRHSIPLITDISNAFWAGYIAAREAPE